MAVPQTACPPELAARALPALSARVSAAVTLGPSALLPVLGVTLSTIAGARLAGVKLSPPLAPLQAFTSYAASNAVPVPLLCDALLAYPADVAALRPAVAAADEDDLRAVVLALTHRLTGASTPREVLASVRLLHALLRADDSAGGIILEEAEGLVPALATAYGKLNGDRPAIRAKAETLTFVRALAALAGPGSGVLRSLLGTPGARGTPLVDQGAADDYALFEGGKLGEAQGHDLRALHDDERGDDPRLVPLMHLFPSLPAHLLADALAHPAYAAAGSRATVDEQAAPLVEAILSGTLPADLNELRAAAADIGSGSAAHEEQPQEQKSNGTRIERRNVFDDMDYSKLRLKGQIEPTVGAEIPDNLRASILRLVEAQEIEAEEAARAVAEAHGEVYRPHRDDSDMESDDARPARLRPGDGEESGDEDDSRAASPAPERSAASQTQTLLELAYLRTPALFERDSATRRSAARKDLREQTGMDDGQIEGWKIMLERNPHKDAILERHQLSRGAPAGGKREGGSSGGGGGGGGRGGRGGGGDKGRGGGQGGQGGGGRGGGSGGGRGRGANKGSRGHSNAARTRGHDKKLQRMGAGL